MPSISKRVNRPITVVVCLCLWGAVGCSPHAPKIHRIGVLSGLDYFASITDGFKSTLAELGYAEGKNIVFDVMTTSLDVNAYQTAIDHFVNRRVDLILAFPTEAAMIAKARTRGTGIPVIAANVFLENTGLIDNILEPGSNITGIYWLGPGIALKRLEIMLELAPGAKTLWIPYMESYPTVPCQLKALHQAQKTAGITLLPIPAKDAASLEALLNRQASLTGAPDAILNIPEPLCVQADSFKTMAKFAAARKIPIGGASMSVDGYESLFGFIPQNQSQGKQAAFQADKVLKGFPAGSIPAVAAENHFQINLRAAAKLGLEISEGLLSRADEIIR